MDSKVLERLLQRYEQHCVSIVKYTQVKIGESLVDKLARIKRLEKDYIAWFEYYFPHYAKCRSAKFHKDLAKLIVGNKKIRCLAEIYRGGAKSTHVDLGIPLYIMFVLKDLHFFLLMGSTEPKAIKLIGDIQAELKTNIRLRNDYGNKSVKGDWSKGDFVTSDGVRFIGYGFDTDPRGLREGSERPDYIVVDDVDGKKHIANDRLMGEFVDRIEEEIIGCFDTSDDCTERFVFANNNFHKNSITNRLKIKYNQVIKAAKKTGQRCDHAVLSVPAVIDLKTFTPTWPEKTSEAYWRKKYNDNRRSFLRERMHIHVADGKIFLNEMMQWKKMLRLDQYDCLVLYGDLSYKEQGDYKAMVLVGKIGREFHKIHCFLRKVSRSDAAKWLYDLYERRKLYNHDITYKIEGLFAQDEFINDFDEEGDERGYYIPIVADKRPKEGKFDRVESLLGFYQKRFMWWNVAEKDDSDQVEAVEQFTSFEKGSKAHDDFPDAEHGAIREIQELCITERGEPESSSRQEAHRESRHRS